MGMVAPSAHHMGRTTSAKSPNIVKTIQKIFRSTALLAANFQTVTSYRHQGAGQRRVRSTLLCFDVNTESPL